MEKKCLYVGIAALTACVSCRVLMKQYRQLQCKLENSKNMGTKLSFYFEMQNQWIRNKNKGLRISDILNNYGISRVAIYGAGAMGEALYEELKTSGITVLYFIDTDKNKQLLGTEDGCKVIALDYVAGQEPVDAYIITAFYYFDSISERLKKNGIDGEKILSLEDLVYEC